MGTTLCCLSFHPEGLIYAHVGDSRIYRLRQGQLEQLTQDHSLLRELIELGQLSEQQAEEFLYKNIITKAIGTELSVEPSVAQTNLEEGDVLLMCTDGLTDLVCRKEMQELLNRYPEEEAVQMLVGKAKENGGYDNITIILVKVKEKLSGTC
jgi:protein phosphatase